MARRAQPPPPAPTRQGAIQGGLIGIERDGVVGWARDPAHPESPVQIRLVAGGHVLAEAIANQFDDARVRTLVGPGIAGFATRLLIAPPGPYPLPMTLHDMHGNMLGMPLAVQSEALLAPLVGDQPMLTYEGALDGVFEGALKGWVRDSAAPDAMLEVELLDTGRPVDRVTASQLRPDLRDAGLHHGLYGYTFDLPVALLDGRAHSLTVRVADTSVTLQGGPIAFGPLATSALMTQMSSLQAEVASLRMLVDALVAPDGAVQRRIMQVLSERVVAQADIERERLDRDIAALKTMVLARPTTLPEQYGAAPPRKTARGR